MLLDYNMALALLARAEGNCNPKTSGESCYPPLICTAPSPLNKCSIPDIQKVYFHTKHPKCTGLQHMASLYTQEVKQAQKLLQSFKLQQGSSVHQSSYFPISHIPNPVKWRNACFYFSGLYNNYKRQILTAKKALKPSERSRKYSVKLQKLLGRRLQILGTAWHCLLYS